MAFSEEKGKPHAHALILAGGLGTRALKKPGIRKPFEEVDGIPLLAWTSAHFLAIKNLSFGVTVVPDPESMHLSKDLYVSEMIRKGWFFARPGPSGQESIRNGLELVVDNCLQDDESCWVMVHDGVRPFISQGLISDLLDKLSDKTPLITSNKVLETPALVVDGNVTVPNRDHSWFLRAPQCFPTKLLRGLHIMAQQSKLDISKFPDSASLAANFGIRLRLIEGPVENMKVTYPSDFIGLSAKLQEWNSCGR